MMKTSANGRAFIEQWEGLYLRAYQDSGGVWTIGYGHTAAAGTPIVRAGMTITKEEADAILAADLASVEADVNHHVTATINQNQYDCLVSFDFNTGALDRSNVLRSINSGQFGAVPEDLMMWDHVGARIVQGLYNRRKAEGELFVKPVVVAAAEATAPPKFTPPGPKPMPQPEVTGDILDALRNLITVIKRAA